MTVNPSLTPGSANVALIRRNTLAALPFTLLVPVGFALAYWLLDVSLRPSALLIGALGWLVALGLRAPVSIVLLKALKTPERVQPWVVAASGGLLVLRTVAG